MAARMPILCQHDVAEFCGQPVDDRHHVVTARHGERAAGAKVVLYIDDDEDAVIAKHRGQIVSHDFPLNDSCSRSTTFATAFQLMRRSTAAASVFSSAATST